MTRTDIHKPSTIIPADYDFVAYDHIKIEGFGDCEYVLAQRRLIEEHKARTGGTYASHEHGGNCMVCGAHAVYTSLFYHQLTNTYVRTGNECAEKLGFSDDGGFNLFKKQCRLHAGIAKGKAAGRKKWLDAGLTEALAIVDEYRGLAMEFPGVTFDDYGTPQGKNEDIWAREKYLKRWEAAQKLSSMLQTTETHGVLSDKMLSAIGWLITKHTGFEELQAKRDAEREAAADCPKGRVEVTGIIVKRETRDTEFGLVTKMTVKATTGFMVYCTMPREMMAERGDTVTFTVTLTPSDRDPKFGFGSRPTFAKPKLKSTDKASSPS